MIETESILVVIIFICDHLGPYVYKSGFKTDLAGTERKRARLLIIIMRIQTHIQIFCIHRSTSSQYVDQDVTITSDKGPDKRNHGQTTCGPAGQDIRDTQPKA